MTSPLQSLVQSGTKLWLDSIDPDLVQENLKFGATGATSNPIIVAGLIETGRFDGQLKKLSGQYPRAEDLTWQVTDELVSQAEKVFQPIWDKTRGNDGYVSFELDPLLEDIELNMPHAERVQRYIELGKKWSHGHNNRMIKVPATPAGIAALPELAAAGVPLNVTLIFSDRQYRAARDAVWSGAQRRKNLDTFKSVYSIFVSRLDIYTEKHCPTLLPEAQGMVGIVNAKRIWKENLEFWKNHPTPLQQEMIFASTGTKKPEDPKWKYVAAFAGSDIETNPPDTNAAVEASGRMLKRAIDEMPAPAVLADIDAKVDFNKLEEILMAEGLAKFADPQKKLLKIVSQKIV